MSKNLTSKKNQVKRTLIADKKKIKEQKEYLLQWDEMFNRLKSYKKEFKKTTVSKDFSDKQLYAWYRTQKKIFNHPTLKMPKEHLLKLNSIGFYFGDGHQEGVERTDKKWLRLLKEALDDGENVQTNHRYRYKGQGLGTYLVGVKKKNKLGEKLELKEKITQAGLDMDETSRDNVLVLNRFVRQLRKDKKPNKFKFQNRFNQQVLPRADVLSKEFKDDLTDAWREKFNEERSWVKGSRLKTEAELLERFVQDVLKTPKTKLAHYNIRFRHKFLHKVKNLNQAQKDKLSEAWYFVYGVKLDWDHVSRKNSVEGTVVRFLEALKDPKDETSKRLFRARFLKSVKPKQKAVNPKLIKEINAAWKKRFSDKLNWKKMKKRIVPEDYAVLFINNLLQDNNPNIKIYKTKIVKIRPVKKDISDDTIRKLENLWELRFNEKLNWVAKKKLTDDDKVKMWKEYRYNEEKNPKGKWMTGPKSMKSIYNWVNRIKKNKYALAQVLVNFTEEELKEMKRQGFMIDLKLAKRAKEFGI